MRRLLAASWGGFLILFGTILLGWVAYNLLVERQPQTEGRSPYPAIALGGAAIWIGIARVRGHRPEEADEE